MWDLVGIVWIEWDRVENGGNWWDRVGYGGIG